MYLVDYVWQELPDLVKLKLFGLFRIVGKQERDLAKTIFSISDKDSFSNAICYAFLMVIIQLKPCKCSMG